MSTPLLRRTARLVATLALALSPLPLVGCIRQQIDVYPDPSVPPPPPEPSPAPYPPPAPPPGYPVYQTGPSSRLGLLFGYRQYDSSWDPFEDQFAFMVTGTHEWPTAPVGVEWGVGFSSTSNSAFGTRFTNQSFELSVGPTRTFHLGGGRWFTNIGAGVAWTYSEEGESGGCCGIDGVSASWFAGYAHAALLYRINPSWDIALDVRGLKGEDADFGPFALEGQYWQVSLGFGFGI